MTAVVGADVTRGAAVAGFGSSRRGDVPPPHGPSPPQFAARAARRSDASSGLARVAGATAAIQYRAAPRRRSATGSFFAVVGTDRTPPGSASPRAAPCSHT